jgi:hypothetical protein
MRVDLPFVAVLILAGASCAGPRAVRESDLADPGALVGNTVQVRTADGRTELVTVTRVEGTTLVGHRHGDAASAVRPPDELRFDLRTREPAASPGASAPAPAQEALAPGPTGEPPVETARYREHPTTLLGKTIVYGTAEGVTDELLVLWVEGTTLGGYRPADREGTKRIDVDVRAITILDVRAEKAREPSHGSSGFGPGDVVVGILGAAVKLGVVLFLTGLILLL